ncbi:F-box/LRR-repeat protein 12 [Rutidosis leptorrhynchoides]|uniref:F-box/LRR-repeat protein 12 n=1 Tax=Rutidosis leptorrhynchoides TaxID=125765 RepID=UPI003A9997BA
MEEGDQMGHSFIMHLPDDCLFLIFDKFDSSVDRESFGLTCHRLLNIQNFSRKSLEFGCSFSRFSHSLSGNSVDIDTFILDKLIKRFTQLESLSLSGCVNLEDSGLVALERYGSKLHSLFLDCCFKVTDKSLVSVAIGCQSLTSISLYRCAVTDNGLIVIAESCVSLKDLNLEWCIPITDMGISSVTKHCRVIRAIKISHCENIKGFGFKDCSQTLKCLEADSCKFEPEGVMDILSGGGLEYVNVSSLSWCVRGNGLKAIGGGFGANIKILNFRVCRFVNDEMIMVISKGCPLLKEWNLSLCTEIGFSGWESIGLYCDNLEKIHVNGCRRLCDRGIAALRNGCKRLSIMYITRCREVSQLAITMFQHARFDVEIKFEEVMCIMPKQFF